MTTVIEINKVDRPCFTVDDCLRMGEANAVHAHCVVNTVEPVSDQQNSTDSC